MNGSALRAGVGARLKCDGEVVTVEELFGSAAGNEVLVREGPGRLSARPGDRPRDGGPDRGDGTMGGLGRADPRWVEMALEITAEQGKDSKSTGPR
ncbi:hypothetical protein [Streptomyces sp. NPDC054765]